MLACLLIGAAAASAQTSPAPNRDAPRSADYIVAVVNQELVTNGEVQQRLASVRRDATQSGAQLPSEDELRRQVLETLINERAQLGAARESGTRVDEPELDRAVANVATQNRLTLAQLRERLQREGMDFARFRNNLRDQILVERVREREVQKLIKISDSEIDAQLQARSSGAAPAEYNVAQVLIAVPDGAGEAELAQRRAVADTVLAKALAGGDFAALVNEFSNGPKDNGGALGPRPADRLPDLFADAVRDLKSGSVVPQVLRSGAGFHVLKLVDRRDGGMVVTQTRARHILLRISAELTESAAIARLWEFRQQVESGKSNFAQLARLNSEDGSAAQGGDLGWASPGQFVPEFEQAMKGLAINEISQPVVSRFGVHLIQVLERRSIPVDRKQLRDIARNQLREQKFEGAYLDWSQEVRARAYVEMRDPPQ